MDLHYLVRTVTFKAEAKYTRYVKKCYLYSSNVDIFGFITPKSQICFKGKEQKILDMSNIDGQIRIHL